MAGFEGARLGNYRVLQRIGGGGMGDVYLAEQPELGRQVAIKVLRGDPSLVTKRDEQRQAMRQFITEARAIAALEHPHIIPLYDFGEQNGILFLVMQYVPFGSLSDFLANAPLQRYRLPLPPPVVADLITQAAGALQFAHDHNIVHLDVKPQNLLLRILPISGSPSSPPLQNAPAPDVNGPDREISVQLHLLLADFGLARFITWISAHSGVTGTPLYTAPEQYQGRSSPATDQYALAGVAYLLLTGEPVFKGVLAELYHQHLSVAPRPATQLNPQLPPAINGVLARALAKDPAQRFARIHDFGQALKQAIGTTNQPQAYWMPINSISSTGWSSNVQAGQFQAEQQAGASGPSSPTTPWYGTTPPFSSGPAAMPASQQRDQSLNQPASGPSMVPQSGRPFDPDSGWLNAPTITSTPGSPPLPGSYAPATAGLPPEPPAFSSIAPAQSHPQRLPDGPRAPLPPGAQKLADRPRFPLRKAINHSLQLPLWQRLLFAGLACLVVASSITLLLLTLNRAHPTPASQVHVATENIIRYGSVNVATFPEVNQAPQAVSTLPARLRTASDNTPIFLSNLSTIPIRLGAQFIDTAKPSGPPPIQLPAAPLQGLTKEQVGIDSPLDVSIASNGATAIEVVDGAMQIIGSTSKALDLANFFQQLLGQSDVLAEPRVLFDTGLGVWIVVVNQLDIKSNGSINGGFFDVAFSESPDPLGKWDVYQLSTLIAGYSGCNWADYPQIGSNAIGIFFTGTSFDCGQNGILRGADLWELPKGVLSIGAVETLYVVTGFLNAKGNPVVTLTPAQESSQQDTEWLVSTDAGYVDNGQTSRDLYIWAAVVDPLKNKTFEPALVGSQTRLSYPYADPPPTPQFGSAALLATGDARVTQAQLVGSHLYAAFTSAMNWATDSTTRAGIHWLDLSPTVTPAVSDSANRTLSVHVNQEGIFGHATISFFYPVFVADAFGNAVLFAEAATSWLYPHLVFTSRKQSTPLNTLGGQENSYVFPNLNYSTFNGQHWGDYVGGCVVTPTSDTASASMWIAGPYVDSGTGTWQIPIWKISTKRV